MHGKPSGIDNTICSIGGLIYFRSKNYERLVIPSNYSFLVIYSGEKHNTRDVVYQISEMKKNNPIKMDESFQEIGNLTNQALEFINQKKFQKIPDLMKRNQEILEDLKLSTPNIDKIIKLLRENNITGSKITGAGKGGCVIAFDNSQKFHHIIPKLKKMGFPAKICKFDEY